MKVYDAPTLEALYEDVPQEIKDRVASGAAFMDERHEGWAHSIVLKKLDMAHGDRCIFGQYHGDFIQGVEIEKLPLPYKTISRSQVVKLGFTLPDSQSDEKEMWEWLDIAWAHEITIRRAQAEPTMVTVNLLSLDALKAAAETLLADRRLVSPQLAALLTNVLEELGS